MAALYDNAATIVPKFNPADEDVVTINFVEDGLSAFGKVWVRGEELSVKRGTPEWESTCDRDGNSWLDLDDREQYARWGAVRFREGFWAGRSLTEIEDPALSDDDLALLAKAEEERNAALSAAETTPETAAEPAAEKPAPRTRRSAAKKAEKPAAEKPAGDDDFLDELNKD